MTEGDPRVTFEAAPTPMEELRLSAKGWHGAQLAVLGFIGLCGVLLGDAGSDSPRWLEILAGLLVLAALVLSCAATALVASVAWPLYAAQRTDLSVPDATAHHAPGSRGEVPDAGLRRAARRLRTGIALTYVAVVVLALAATSAWWPHPQGGAFAEVRTDAGTFCGELTASGGDGVSMVIAGQRIDIGAASLRGLRPVVSCP